MALVFLRGQARKVCMAEQAEKVWIGGWGERRVEQVVGDVHHVLLHQVPFRQPCWVEKYINKGWFGHREICTPLPSPCFKILNIVEIMQPLSKLTLGLCE